MDLAGRVCIVTGGANGIGRAMARRLAAEQARVCVADVDDAALQETVKLLRKEGGSASAIHCDVSDRAAVRAMIRSCLETFGALNVIFNNAGIAQAKDFLDIQEADWKRLMDVNGLGTLICMQEAAKQMIAQGTGGKIINTASIAGKQGFAQTAHYCATKFAVVSLTQSGAKALAKHKITVNAICPGVVATEMWKKLDLEMMGMGLSAMPGEAFQQNTIDIPLGRPSVPEDLGGIAVFLASADSDYLTGQSIVIDGGIVFS